MTFLLAALAGFEFTVIDDLITGEKTYAAHLQVSRTSSLAIVCGAKSGGQMAVDFKPGRILADRHGGLLLPFTNRIRFSGAEPTEVKVEYWRGHILITGDDAKAFAEQAKAAATVAFEYSDFRGGVYQTLIPLDGAADSVAKVEASCR